jgi:hypothetical protein
MTTPPPAPFFSVVVPDFEGAVTRAELRRGIGSLARQTFADLEILLLHDGPKGTAYDADLEGVVCPYPLRTTVTEARANDFGHSLRDLGIRQARGRYVLHFNADNVLYPHALARIHAYLTARVPPIRVGDRLENGDDIAIFAVLMRGMTCVGQKLVRFKGHERQFALILTGAPPRMNRVDCMQLVMKRELWLAEGGWSDRSERSDGVLYPRFVAKYGARYIPEVLGEHW